MIWKFFLFFILYISHKFYCCVLIFFFLLCIWLSCAEIFLTLSLSGITGGTIFVPSLVPHYDDDNCYVHSLFIQPTRVFFLPLSSRKSIIPNSIVTSIDGEPIRDIGTIRIVIAAAVCRTFVTGPRNKKLHRRSTSVRLHFQGMLHRRVRIFSDVVTISYIIYSYDPNPRGIGNWQDGLISCHVIMLSKEN